MVTSNTIENLQRIVIAVEFVKVIFLPSQADASFEYGIELKSIQFEAYLHIIFSMAIVFDETFGSLEEKCRQTFYRVESENFVNGIAHGVDSLQDQEYMSRLLFEGHLAWPVIVWYVCTQRYAIPRQGGSILEGLKMLPDIDLRGNKDRTGFRACTGHCLSRGNGIDQSDEQEQSDGRE